MLTNVTTPICDYYGRKVTCRLSGTIVRCIKALWWQKQQVDEEEGIVRRSLARRIAQLIHAEVHKAIIVKWIVMVRRIASQLFTASATTTIAATIAALFTLTTGRLAFISLHSMEQMLILDIGQLLGGQLVN